VGVGQLAGRAKPLGSSRICPAGSRRESRRPVRSAQGPAASERDGPAAGVGTVLQDKLSSTAVSPRYEVAKLLGCQSGSVQPGSDRAHWRLARRDSPGMAAESYSLAASLGDSFSGGAFGGSRLSA
jgi:hypothetical protein